MKKNLYLLYELIDREFESKLLLSILGSKKNFRCFILDRNFFLDNIPKFEPGIVVYKSVVPNDERIIKKVKEFGNIFVCIDEEGILQWDEEYIYKIRYGDNSLEILDFLIMLNKKQENLLLQNYKIDGKKYLTFGYPRIEFLEALSKKHELSNISKNIKNKYGKYIFFPTSFPSNHMMGKKGNTLSIQEALGKKEDTNQKKFYANSMNLIHEMEKHYIDLLFYLAKKHQDLKIILRPHPTESVEVWKDRIKNFKNIKIDSEYPSFYYLKNSFLTIQYGSTISVESFVMKHICYQYDPISIDKNLKKYELTDHNKFIIRFKNFSQIDEIIKNKNKNKITEGEIDRLNLKSNYEYLKINTFPSDKIVNFLSKIPNIKKTRYKKLPLWKMVIKKRHIYHLIFWFISKIRLIDLIPQFILVGKFSVLKKDFKPLYINHFRARKIKNKLLSKLRFDDTINIFKNSNYNLKNVKIKKIFHNNYIIQDHNNE